MTFGTSLKFTRSLRKLSNGQPKEYKKEIFATENKLKLFNCSNRKQAKFDFMF